MSSSYCVYIHKNRINGKQYCGITSQSPENRWRDGGGYPHNQHFQNAISKYGWDCFEHIILCSGVTREEACALEREYISKYNLTNPDNGYNQTNGGEGTDGYTHTEETRLKMSQSRQGRICTPETRRKISLKNRGECNGMFGVTPWNKNTTISDATKQKISQSKKGKTAGLSHPMYGRHHSEATRVKMSKSHEGSIPWNKGIKTDNKPPNAQRVGMFDDNGNLLRVYESMRDAAKDVGGHYTNISACCRGKVGHASGFVWKYIDKEVC